MEELPKEIGRAAKFWDNMSARYAKDPIKDQLAYETKLAKTKDYFTGDMVVLELGCGTGTTALIHASYVKQIRAVDISEKMLEIARQKANAQGVTNVSFECSDLAHLDIAENSQDAVLAMSILHLLDDLDGTLTRLHEVLKPGGVFVSSTVCLGDHLWFLKPVIAIGHAIGKLPWVAFLSQDKLVSRIQQHGFEVEHLWRPKKKAASFVIAQKIE